MRFKVNCTDDAMNKIRRLLCRKQKPKSTAFNPFSLKVFDHCTSMIFLFMFFFDSKVMYICLLLIYAVQNEEYLIIISTHHQYKTHKCILKLNLRKHMPPNTKNASSTCPP